MAHDTVDVLSKCTEGVAFFPVRVSPETAADGADPGAIRGYMCDGALQTRAEWPQPPRDFDWCVGKREMRHPRPKPAEQPSDELTAAGAPSSDPAQDDPAASHTDQGLKNPSAAAVLRTPSAMSNFTSLLNIAVPAGPRDVKIERVHKRQLSQGSKTAARRSVRRRPASAGNRSKSSSSAQAALRCARLPKKRAAANA